MEKKFEDFLQSINENLITDLKKKVTDYFDNFQNKEAFYRRLYAVLSNGNNALIVAWFGVILFSILKIIIKREVDTTLFVFSTIIMSFIFYISLRAGEYLRKERVKVIRDKANELKRSFNGERFKYVFLVLGDKSDVNKFINKILEDDVLTNKYILRTEEATLIDFLGLINHQRDNDTHPSYREVDPYGEEDWDNKERILTGTDIVVICNAITCIKKEYKIRLTSIVQWSKQDDDMILGYGFNKKKKKIDRGNYLYWKNQIGKSE